MDTRYLPDIKRYGTMDAEALRENFLVKDLFQEDKIQMVYFDLDRPIVGGALPCRQTLHLKGTKKEMGTEYFAQRREIGVFNIGGPGKVKADNQEFSVGYKDAVYIGMGTKELAFSSMDKSNLACLYFVSYPAHSSYPTTLMRSGEVFSARLGSQEEANLRTLNRYIHPGGVKSAQLVMGLTELDRGSVWNTMPSHTHQRRTEVYFYFNVTDASIVFHLMGEPSQTRHIIVRNKQAVVSPSWSIHSGAGTRNYSFIWAMGGENQEFEDMDSVETSSLR
ncbi:MAG TPA: 5-dehydro-4-deoxy-D-glucuronate isomerase [Bacteroidota bacterium]|nr:5-dehydro-4-deoxy-D-glucuronate isomerase [Bacteroidota bacterium]